jgi:Ser/Thr protein kinase RdoA (MazF antagonist)
LKCPALEKREFCWDLFYFDTLLQGHKYITSEEKKFVKAVENSFKKSVKPRFDVLPKQCIHGDINDANIIVQKNSGTNEFEATGLIDFGDVNYSCRVFDIAIAAAYMLTVSEDNAIDAGASTVAGFHDKCPLTQDESDVILCCMKARICQSICFAARTSAMYPDNAEYLLYNAGKMSAVLTMLADITDKDFDERWRNLCKNK